jgi:hypothetical protein
MAFLFRISAAFDDVRQHFLEFLAVHLLILSQLQAQPLI